MNKDNWIKTDDNQFTKRISKNVFIIINIDTIKDKIALGIDKIDLNKFTEKTLNEYIVGYYDSLSDIKKQYKDSWGQIVAEIISEVNFIYVDKVFFDKKEELCKYLKENNIGISLIKNK